MSPIKLAKESVSEETWPAIENVPQHIGIIMDGNGRWAQARNLPRIAGHRRGTDNLRQILEAAVEFGVKMLTIYAFSTENWKRPEKEIRGLMSILEHVIDRELNELHKNGVQLRHIGRLDGINEELKRKVRYAIELTKNNDRLILNVAFNYGGRAEIINAIQNIIRDGVAPEDVDEDLINQYLYTAGLPDPDLIIRTSGEFRTSNFLVWQGAYAEYYVTPTFWPDFNKAKFYEALQAFSRRERRYGGVVSS
ncbi:MAG: isoprenyl transferase [Anaerolineae bacterium]